MILDDQLSHFLAARRKLIRSWPFLGVFVLLLIGGFLVWLHKTNPLLVNPVAVNERLGAGSLDAATLELMAGMVPILFLTCAFLVCVLVLFMFSVISNEKMYLHIIDDLMVA